MKTTVVPAQITTVEDRIAGNLTFTQIILLIFPLITSAALYSALPPHNGLGALKISLIALQFCFFGSLALRIKGKVVMDWLLVYLRFSLRPRIYVFTKNDPTCRDVAPVEAKEKAAHKAKKAVSKEAVPALTFPEHSLLTELLENKNLTIGFAMSEKGGVNVSLTKQG
jgi:hypothetical protein